MDLYKHIKYPAMLPLVQDLLSTLLQYPVLFHQNRGQPKKEIQFTKPNVSIQKCSLCKQQGKLIDLF